MSNTDLSLLILNRQGKVSMVQGQGCVCVCVGSITKTFDLNGEREACAEKSVLPKQVMLEMRADR